MSVLPPECNQNESPIQFILTSSLNTHISRVVKLFAWSLNLKSINLIISAGGFHLRSLVPNQEFILKCGLITSFQCVWKSHGFLSQSGNLTFLLPSLGGKHPRRISTYCYPFIFFHLDFINRNKGKLIMQVNLCFGVLTTSPHNCKTIKWKLQNEKNTTLKITACLMLLSLLY